MRERTTDEYKQAVIQRLLDSPLSFRQFSIEEGMAHATLHKWKKRFYVGTDEPTVHRSSDRLLVSKLVISNSPMPPFCSVAFGLDSNSILFASTGEDPKPGLMATSLAYHKKIFSVYPLVGG